MSHREYEEALSAELGARHRHAMDAEIKRDNEGKFAATSGVAAKHGYEESGGGDDFTQHSRLDDKGQATNKHVYVHENGSWEHHNLDRQNNDNPESAVARGKNHKDLDKHLTSYHAGLKHGEKN
jgi:hypothetical protein